MVVNKKQVVFVELIEKVFSNAHMIIARQAIM